MHSQSRVRTHTFHYTFPQLKKLGVMEGTQYPCAAFDYMTQDEQTSWLANRASVVLFIATLRRDVKLCSSLLDIGESVLLNKIV